MPAEVLRADIGCDLRSGFASGATQSFHQTLGCSKPFVAGRVVHVVLNEQMASGVVRNHFVTATLGADPSGGDGAGSGAAGGRVRSWCSTGTRPVRAIQALDDECATLVYAKGGLFCFATAPPDTSDASPTTTTPTAPGSGSPRVRALAAAAAAVAAAGGGGSSGAAREGGGGCGGGNGGGGGGGGGAVFDSLPVHSGSVVDFRVNPVSRDIVSGCDHGHVHVLNFPWDMAGVPTMKVSKYVAQPLSSVRWGMGEPYVASWTSSRGLLQMLDTRDYRVVTSIQVEGSLPVHTHEYLSDVVLAVGCGVGCVQLFDIRKMATFVTLQDPVAGSVHQQIVPSVSGGCSTGAASACVGDWVAFGTAGLSRYTVGSRGNGGAGAAVGVSPDENVLSRVAGELSLTAGCRTSDLSLPAGLDVNAGLFLAPTTSGSGGGGSGGPPPHQLGITGGGGGGGGGGNGTVAGAAAAGGEGGETAARSPPSPVPTARSPVAPADGSNLGGGSNSRERSGNGGACGVGEGGRSNSAGKGPGEGGDGGADAGHGGGGGVVGIGEAGCTRAKSGGAAATS
ncbi:unnamed protein product [Ectocarpus fasciculatus]